MGSGASPTSPPERYAARREASSFTRLARFANLPTGSGGFTSLVAWALHRTPGSSAFTRPSQLYPEHDYYTRGLRLHPSGTTPPWA
ncbi:hypothetical protein OsI_36540 [Oryza sativa Indica Group]|uniref:Uncharacterized protein n=1 Tax=Oryza sativa subsp. indica TaxID=39946 RepID=B8BL52_ORYSI|nr:hypothetical protein OsI_36540 [Oryza sativa Indica Group]